MFSCGSLFLQSSQSLWNRLSVLLNLLPSAADLQESGMEKGSTAQCSLLPAALCLPGRDFIHVLFSAQTPLGSLAIP